ncbi:MAG: helix-turn-helix transcriptional regulator [Armatimonadetes bacterium]|nr:helix-turn-helix transcriptional regulator [Armatimonadota bacterium]
MRMSPGTYFGSQLQQRKTGGVYLTACRYEPNTVLPRHTHELPGFFLLVSGHHREINEHGELEQPVSQLLYHQQERPHKTFVGPGGMIGLNIAFDLDWLGSLELSAPPRDGLVLGRPRARQISTKLTARIQAGSPSELEDSALELLDLIYLCPRAEETRLPTWLRAVRAAIDTRFQESISLASLAREVAVHPVYLARAFRRFYGITLTDYLQQARVANAHRLILEGMAIGDAAIESGFCDQAYLSRIVRRKFDLKPSELNWFRSSKRQSLAAN